MSTSSNALLTDRPDAARPPGNVLEYQQSSRSRRWRRFAARWMGRLLVPAVVLGIACAGWWWRVWIADWIGWQMAMRAAWRHEMPAEGASILVNGEKAKRLASESYHYVLDADGVAVYRPAALRRLADYDWRLGHMERSIRAFPGRDVYPITFMGLMRRPDGQKRLVVVTGGACNADDLLEDVQVLVLPPPSVAGSERLACRLQMAMQRTGQLVPAVLHMGHLDPSDSGRLLVPFSILRNLESAERGLISLELDDADVLNASIVVTVDSESVQLQTNHLSMPPAGSAPPFPRAPWRTATINVSNHWTIFASDFDW